MNDFVNANKAEILSVLSEMIACNTENPPGDEYLCAKVVTTYLDKYSIPYSTYEKAEGRTNVVATLGEGPRTLLMSAHMDVVPAGDGWNTDPYQMVSVDGKLYGRGTSDDKGPLAGLLTMLKYFSLHPEELGCKLVVVAAADEERGSQHGLRFLVTEGLVNPDFVAIGDIDGDCLRIDVAEKGVFQLELKTVGKQAHASVPHEGHNAVYAMCDWIKRLTETTFEYKKHSILDAPTYNIGKISGGIAPNVVAGNCTAVLDMRILPGMDPEAIQKKLLELAAIDNHEGITYDVVVTSYMVPTEVMTDNPDLVTFCEAIEAVKGGKPEFVGSGGATDCKAFIEKGIPAVAFGPAANNVAHLANEYIEEEAIYDYTKVIIGFAKKFR